MKHEMKLLEQPFNSIKSGKKIIEIRCNDEKRQRISVGDIIVFSKLPTKAETLTVRVAALHQYPTFEALYNAFDFSAFGCEGLSMQQMLDETYKIYTKEKEAQYGVLGIELQVI